MDAHQLLDGNGTRPGDTTDIVATKVDQHDVLGAFLGVLQQLVRQPLVLRQCLAARAGPGDGAGFDRAVDHFDQRLG